MYAVIQIESEQFKVEEGETILTKRMKQEEGKEFGIDTVLLFSKGSDVRIGQPYLKDVKVKVKLVKHQLGNKVTSLKYRRTKDSATKTGHREKLSQINITKIAA
jgi:large subunit ribosomal protein L21